MRHIHVLDTHTINKIAAGEVVERPGSVVKELVENAIDADASSITIEIRDGGTSFIRITDNGRGIPRDEVKMAFLRHATSKITQAEDLEEVLSLGFRGEALASISAVSQVELLTKTAEEETGTIITIHGGEVLNFGETGILGGTTLVVQNLFYNVPARRKFLKKPAAESTYISEIVNKMALGHPEVSFKYINNDMTVLHTPGNHDLKTVAFHVYGKETAAKLLPVEYKTGDYRVFGLVGKPELSRANRSYENLFINGRYVKNDIVSSAVEDAYKTRIMTGRFPVFMLELSIPPEVVDVNVHPAKLEVRFRDEDGIYDLIYKGVQKAFEGENLIPTVTWDKPVVEKKPAPVQETLSLAKLSSEQKSEAEELPQGLEKQVEVKPTAQVTSYLTPEKPRVSTVDKLLNKKKPKGLRIEQDNAEMAPAKLMETPKPTYLPPQEEKKPAFFQNYRVVGRIFATYWLVEQGDSFFMIDQHAAHERILYEKLLSAFQRHSPLSQPLVAPIPIRLSPMEKRTLNANMAFLRDCGFGLVETAEGLDLVAVPILFQNPVGEAFLKDLLDTLAEGRMENVYEAKLHGVATMACKAAVKAGDRLSEAEARAIIEGLLTLENPFTCPHGRPTIIEMSRYELEKKFKRIV